MTRTLIVNADDCNLTPGVTQAILDCHDHGILTSTTFLINLSMESTTIRSLKSRRSLGVGLHLNITLAKPVAPPDRIRSLLSRDGGFRKVGTQLQDLPRALEVEKEYRHQIERFRKVFGRLPTHLDTHHQVHDHPFFLNVLLRVAANYRLPVRRSQAMPSPWPSPKGRGEKTIPLFRVSGRGQGEGQYHFLMPDYFFGNLSPKNFWTRKPLETLLAHLPEGISEIMCHPGENDRDLQAISSFREGREVEWKIFSDLRLKKEAIKRGIRLSHYGMLYCHQSA